MTTPVGGGMVACPACGEANRAHARFCSSCGGAFDRRCELCGNELEAGAQFCDECGAPMQAPVSPAALLQAAEARKVVTIVFADLAGSTALQERMDPESVRVVMQRYYAAIRDVVEARGGLIVKFIGDGAMAVFGIPETNEEDALRALDAALAMHAAFAELADDVARERGASIALRVGVNTGEVVVSADDTDVVGDAVNLAARLERAATSGNVLVGEATWRLTRGHATFGEMRELHVAGKADDVRAWPLVAIDGDAIELRTELVGRGGELAILQRAFADAVRTGTPRLVTVLGSPGVGKTRLASELERDVAGAATVLTVRCTQQTEAPLAPVAEMLHAAVAGSAADPDATVERLGALLGDVDRDRVLRTVAAILANGAGTTPEETLWALRLLFEQRARERPVVLLVDDVQWAEAMLLDLVEHLAEWTRAALLLVVTARPELRERRAALADGARHSVVALEGLDPDATARLACEILGARSLPSELIARLPGSTGGNPLFVRELLRMLVDDDVLRAGADGMWELRVAPDAIDVPPTIQSLLAARLDRLTTDEQIVLERAAVWGTEFPLGALVELVPSDVAPRVASVLELLRRKELMESAGSYWIDEPVHRFHHVLIRDAAYRRMLRDVRASLHERLAAWVDTKTQSVEADYDELVGHHLEQAYLQRGELGPPDAQTAQLGRAASTRLGTAAQRALDRDDPSAAPLAARALACLSPADGARADVLLVRCDALLAAADTGAARDAVAELEALASSPRLYAWAACFAAQLATITDPAHLLETEQRAATVAGELAGLGDARGAAKAHTVHAGALARLGRFGEVEAALDRALTSAREAGDRRLATVALAAAPVAAVWGPSPVPRAGGRCLDVVRLLRITAGSPVVEATSLRCQAVLEAFRGRFDAARRLVGSARDTVQELGLVHGLLEAELFAGIVELGAGDLDAAGACFRTAYDGLRALGADADAARAGALLARVALERGDTDEAERLAREAEQLAGDDLQAGISWRGVQAEVLARRGAHDDALALAEAAVAIASRTDALVHHADACAALAAVRRAAGDIAGAIQAEHDATELYERKGATALAQLARSSPVASAEQDRAERAERRPTPLQSRATRGVDAWCECFARSDWQGLAALIAPDHVFDDRRALIGGRTVGREPSMAILKGYAALGIEKLIVAFHALRGEGLVLAEFLGAGHDGSVIFEASTCVVVEVDANDLTTAQVVFEDLDGALDELDRRYIVAEGAAIAPVLGAITAFHRAYNRRDWEAVHDACSPGVELVDHRPVSWPTLDRDGIVRNLQDLFTADARMMLSSIEHATDGTLLGRVVMSGHDAAGALVDAPLLVVASLGTDGIERMETFPVDRSDDALTVYRRLAGIVDHPTNRCVEVYARWAELFAARDWGGMSRVASESFEFDDRRLVVGRRDVGADALATSRWYAAEASAARAIVTSLATRGDRLALVHTVYVTIDGTDVFGEDGPCVFELGEDGRLAAGVVFSAADLDAAYAELDRRYLDGEGAAHREMLALMFASNRAFNERDWDALQATYTSAIQQVDGFTAGWASSGGRADVFSDVDDQIDELPDARARQAVIHACSDDAAVATVYLSGTTTDGARIERITHLVHHRVGAAFDRLESFPAERLEDALAAYRRLTHAVDEPTNRCVEAYTRWTELFASRDWAAMRGIVADGFQFDDRRPLLRHHADGPVELQYMQGMANLGERVAARPLATRGERLALLTVRTQTTDADAARFSSESLLVVEIDEAGALRAVVDFPAGKPDAAVAELDRRYISGEGAPHADMLRLVVEHATRAYNARDWDAFRAGCALDVVLVDHRPGSWGTLRGVDEEIGALQEFLTLAPDLSTMIITIHALSARHIVYTVRVTGHRDDGGDVEAGFHLATWRGSGAIDRVEVFPLESLEDALAAVRRPTTTVNEPTNRCVEVFHRWSELFAARAWDDLRAIVAANFVLDDRRPVWRHHGAEVARHMHLLADDYDAWTISAVAVRGERLALIGMRDEATVPGTEAFAVETLAVIELDNDARFASLTAFAPDDLLGAYTELDRRFIAGEGAPYAALLECATRQSVAVNARDWAAARREYAPEVTVVDHFTGGWDERRDADAVLEFLRSIFDTRPGAFTIAPEVHALRADTIVCSAVLTAAADDGERVDLAFLNLMHYGPEGIDRVESWPADRLDDALAAFRRLAATDCEPTNRCVEVFRRWTALFAARAWDDMMTVLAENFVWDDRRPVWRELVHGASDAQHLRLLADEFDAWAVSAVAVRGERLALVTMRGEATDSGTDPFAIETLALIEIDDAARFASLAAFPSDDVPGAYAELDARYIGGEGAPYAEMLELVARQSLACNARDWEALRGVYAPNIVSVNAGFAGGWETSDDREALLSAMAQMFAVWADARAVVRAIPACSTDAIVCSTETAANADGAPTEIVHHIVYHRTGSTIDRMEVFDEDHLDDALAAYQRLIAAAHTLKNRCTASKDSLCRAVEQHDWETVERVFSDPRFEGVDRRRGMHATGGDPVKGYRVSTDLGVAEIAYTPIAIRGQSLALGEEVYRGRGDGALEVRILVVNEVDSDGRIVYHAAFEVDDLDAAIADLEDRYVAREGQSVAPTWSGVVAGHRAQSARDWDAFAAGFTRDLVSVDHHYGLTDGRGRDAYVEVVASLTDPFPATLSIPVEVLAICDDAVAFVGNVVERAEFGDALPFITVLHISPSGIDRIETFGMEARAAALTCYERLTANTNACTRAGDLLCELFAQRDWDGFGALFAPNFDGEDYRRGFVSFDADPVKSFGTAVELSDGPASMMLRPIAVRGELFALSDCWIDVGDGGFGLEPGLLLTEVDGDGRFVWMASYDADAHERALADLEARAGRDDARGNRAFSVFYAAIEALVRGDRDAFADAHSPQLRAEDRRPLMARVYGRAELIDDFVRRPAAFELRMVAARGDDLEVHESHYRGRHADVDWEFAQLCVAQIGPDGRIAETVIFDADDLDAAYAELDRRYLERLEATSPAAAAVWRVALHSCAAFNARDWPAVRSAQAPELQYVDHTMAGYGRADSQQLAALSTEIAAATPDVRMEFVQVDAVGASGVVVSVRAVASNEAGGEFESMAWNVWGVGDDVISSIDVFPPDQLLAARARLAELT